MFKIKFRIVENSAGFKLRSNRVGAYLQVYTIYKSIPFFWFDCVMNPQIYVLPLEVFFPLKSKLDILTHLIALLTKLCVPPSVIEGMNPKAFTTLCCEFSNSQMRLMTSGHTMGLLEYLRARASSNSEDAKNKADGLFSYCTSKDSYGKSHYFKNKDDGSAFVDVTYKLPKVSFSDSIKHLSKSEQVQRRKQRFKDELVLFAAARQYAGASQVHVTSWTKMKPGTMPLSQSRTAFTHNNSTIMMPDNLGNIELDRFQLSRDSSPKSLQTTEAIYYEGDVLLTNGKNEEGEEVYSLVLCRTKIIRTTSFGVLKTEGIHKGKRRTTITFNDMDSHRVSHYRLASEDLDGKCRFEWENKHSKVGIYQIVCGVRAEALTSRTFDSDVPGGVKSFSVSKQVHYGMQQQHYNHQQKDKDDDEIEDDESDDDESDDDGDGIDADNEEDEILNGKEDENDAESDTENEINGELNAWRGKIVNPEKVDIQALFAGETMGSYGDDSDSSEDEDKLDAMSKASAGASRQEVIARHETAEVGRNGRGKRMNYAAMAGKTANKRTKK